MTTSSPSAAVVGLETTTRFSLRRHLILLVIIAIVSVPAFWTTYGEQAKALLASAASGAAGRQQQQQQPNARIHVAMDNEGHHYYLTIPEILIETGLYNPNFSFINRANIIPPYWEGSILATEEEHKKQQRNQATSTSSTNPLSSFATGSRKPPRDKRPTIGPCYPYKKHPVDWEKEIDRYNNTKQPWYNVEQINKKNANDLEGYCRPGFIIIGAGKCGTSSLYHYLTMHPNVLPASQKQIHYFKYHLHEPLKWYYQHFPSTASFLSAGALMTGEASPGYIPYPDVVIDMRRRMPKPRLLAIGRHPIGRAYSSYKYNYVDPLIKYMSKGKQDGIPKKQTKEFYSQFLFSFEDMLKAELAVLRECFAPGSEAEKQTRNKWGKVSWIEQEYLRREREGLPHLIDLDGFCYGGRFNETVLRRQWVDLVAEQPDKVIINRNTHLTQALLGRSLYFFPLEWWYTAFSPDHIYFVCTEELEDFSGESMNEVGQFLGLPRYDNFSTVVQGGAYNVGGHKGYDNEISWSQLKKENKSDLVPLSEEFRSELEDFIRPYNERLFMLTGRRCNW